MLVEHILHTDNVKANLPDRVLGWKQSRIKLFIFNSRYIHLKPQKINKKLKSELCSSSGLLQWILFTKPITECVTNFRKPLSCWTYFQNRFPAPVLYGTYFSIRWNIEILRPDWIYLQYAGNDIFLENYWGISKN